MIGQPPKVSAIISALSHGGIRIPEIQRNYDLKRFQVALLLGAHYSSLSTGSILLRAGHGEIFSLDFATSLGSGVKLDLFPKHLLDGQQRTKVKFWRTLPRGSLSLQTLPQHALHRFCVTLKESSASNHHRYRAREGDS